MKKYKEPKKMHSLPRAQTLKPGSYKILSGPAEAVKVRYNPRRSGEGDAFSDTDWMLTLIDAGWEKAENAYYQGLEEGFVEGLEVGTRRGRSEAEKTANAFEEALRHGNSDAADQFISELHSEGRLSITNMAFLRIKYFACAEKWAELLLLPQLTTILDIPRPTLITQYIIQAIYKTFLSKFEKENKHQYE